MEIFVRPALCRLCEFPAGTDGIQLSRVDILKLSRWWRKALGTEFEDEEINEKFICQFCLWNAKFQGERKVSEACDWWTGHDTDQYYQKFYYNDEVIRPCLVDLSRTTRRRVRPSGWGMRVKTKCIYCPETFESRRCAFLHVTKKHKSVETFFCKDCCVHFKSECQKDKHYEKIHLRHFKVRCHLCLKKIDQSILVKHITQNHAEPGQEYFKCCDRKYFGADQLVVHMKLNLVYKMVDCVYCKSTWTINSLPGHVSQCHASEAIKCPYKICGIYFLTKKEKEEHVTKVHESKKGLKQCVYCERKFTRVNLPRHVLLVHKSEAIKCTFVARCLEYFRTEDERQQHVENLHLAKSAISPEWKCKRCARVLATKSSLREHSRLFHNFNPKFCSARKCLDNFSSDEELQKHFLETHSAEEEKKKFQCGQCSFRALTLEGLERHEVRCHGNERYPCLACTKVFRTKGSLKQHLTFHGDKKACPHCGTSVFALTQHLPAKPCHKCGNVFACKGLRRSHTCKIAIKIKIPKR